MWEKLKSILRAVCDDREYLLGIKVHVPTEENKRELLEAIESGLIPKEADAISLYALAIYQDDPFEECPL